MGIQITSSVQGLTRWEFVTDSCRRNSSQEGEKVWMGPVGSMQELQVCVSCDEEMETHKDTDFWRIQKLPARISLGSDIPDPLTFKSFQSYPSEHRVAGPFLPILQVSILHDRTRPTVLLHALALGSAAIAAPAPAKDSALITYFGVRYFASWVLLLLTRLRHATNPCRTLAPAIAGTPTVIITSRHANATVKHL